MKPTSKTESNYKTFLDELKWLHGDKSKGKRWLKRRISKARRVVDKKETELHKLKWYVEYNANIKMYEVMLGGFHESQHYYKKAAQDHAEHLNEIKWCL